MDRRRRSLTWAAGIAAVLLIACTPEPEGRDAPAARRVPAGTDYGAGLTIDAVRPLSEIAAHPDRWARTDVLVEAEVREVCQRKGCWMTLTDGPYQVRVRFKDYAFFVPKDAARSRAFVQGRISAKELSESEARHYAEESETERDREIVGPQRELAFLATGVRLVSSVP